MASYEDAKGTRWVLVPFWGPKHPKFKAPIEHGEVFNGAVAAFRMEKNPATGRFHLNPAWISRDMKHADPPVVANGIVFGFASGEDVVLRSPPMPFGGAPENGGTPGRISRSTHAVLYALRRADRRGALVERRHDHVVESLQRHFRRERPRVHRHLRRHRLLFRVADNDDRRRSSILAGLALRVRRWRASCTRRRAARPTGRRRGSMRSASSWMRVDPYISIDNLSKFQFIWKLKVDNESRHGNALTAPVALGNLMTFRGFKSLIFVGGSSNNVYAIDYDFGTMFWRTHHNYTAGAREYAGSPTCPGGMTLPLTRATTLTPPTQLAFFGFARPPRPAKGDVGEPGRGAPQLAEIAARIAARGNRGGGGDTPAAGSAAARGAAGAGTRDTAAGARRGAGRRPRAAAGPTSSSAWRPTVFCAASFPTPAISRSRPPGSFRRTRRRPD